MTVQQLSWLINGDVILLLHSGSDYTMQQNDYRINIDEEAKEIESTNASSPKAPYV